MTEKFHEKSGVFVPRQNSHFSYVISITLPQPTIRIKIPNVLVMAIHRRNEARKKVGSVFSNVYGKKKKKSAVADSKGENGEVLSNGDGNDEEMKKLKNMVESVDMESEKTARKSTEDNANGGGKQQLEKLETGDGVKEKPKSRRTYSKTLSKRKEMKLKNRKINNIVDDHGAVSNTDLSVACVGDELGANTYRTKGIVSGLKQAENSSDLPVLKTAWSMKKKMKSVVMMGGKSEKQELCKKRILMGGKCRPLNHSGIFQYDDKCVLMPELIP